MLDLLGQHNGVVTNILLKVVPSSANSFFNFFIGVCYKLILFTGKIILILLKTNL